MEMPGTPEAPPQLRVVSENPNAGWVSPAVVADLSAHPFRPGEVPSLVTLRLHEVTRDVVQRAAIRERLPWSLWLRIAGEVARCLAEVADVTRQPIERLWSVCDSRATQPASSHPVVPLAAATLGGYADLLEVGARAGRVPSGSASLRLSDEMYGSWAATAALQRRDLSDWVAEAVQQAPRSCVRYEIAAARASKTLAEWIYASALSAAASSTA